MQKFNSIRTLLSEKYFEKESHNVSNEECSSSAFNLCRYTIVFTDFHVFKNIFNNIAIKSKGPDDKWTRKPYGNQCRGSGRR